MARWKSPRTLWPVTTTQERVDARVQEAGLGTEVTRIPTNMTELKRALHDMTQRKEIDDISMGKDRTDDHLRSTWLETP